MMAVIGQFVLYVPKNGSSDHPFVGIVAGVPSNDKVNLMVLSYGGTPEGKQGVRVVKQGDNPPGEEYCWIIPTPGCNDQSA